MLNPLDDRDRLQIPCVVVRIVDVNHANQHMPMLQVGSAGNVIAGRSELHINYFTAGREGKDT
jgi:hypothetical protein